VLVIVGMVVMVVNVVRTFQQAKGLVDTPVLIPPPAAAAGHA